LCNFYPNKLSEAEIVLITWISTLTLEEIRKILINPARTLKGKWNGYIWTNWNLIGLAAIIFYYCSLILRLIPNSVSCFQAARVIFAVDVFFWFIRSLSAYWHIRKLGPILLLIQRIMEQMFYFLLIILLFLFAFGGLFQYNIFF
jgi:hypothetical protein